jgi:hypothetical protein
MTGKKESVVQSRLDDVQEMLNNFNASIGLGNLVFNPDVDQALSFSMQQLAGMDEEECNSFAFGLDQYSLFIQQKENRCLSIVKWCDHNIRVIVAKEGDQYGDKYTKYEERIYMVCTGNTYAESLQQLKSKSELHYNELKNISNRISNMANKLYSIARVKSNERFKRQS